jgi:hypothetical protein
MGRHAAVDIGQTCTTFNMMLETAAKVWVACWKLEIEQ